MNQIDFFNQVKQNVITSILGDDELGDQLVLKGGNLLQFAYQISARASKDVDISIDGEFEDVDWIRTRVQRCLDATFCELGFAVIDFNFSEVPAAISADVKSFWGGYKCDFKLVSEAGVRKAAGNIEELRRRAHVVGDDLSTKFKIDFSRHEFCGDKEPFEIDGYTIYGYSPRLFVAEKLRAICQQMPEYAKIVHRTRPATARARDFVDIYVIAQHYGVNFDDVNAQDIIKKTFAAKMVPLSLLGKIQEVRDFHEGDFVAVQQTVTSEFRLQEFKFYFDSVCRICSTLESLWNE